MEHIKRNARVAAIVRILTSSPNKIFTLNYFCETFDAAKSTISEDVDVVRETFAQFQLGRVETLAGAAGGVRYQPRYSSEEAKAKVKETCRRLGDPTRILAGGYLYTGDVLSDPAIVEPFGAMLASQFYKREPHFVLTVETRGIPLATFVARAMGVPLVIARRGPQVFEGTQVSINFTSGSTGAVQTMSLARRSVKAGQRALIVDDFLKAGGTIRGMMDLMREFSVQVVGTGVMIERRVAGKSMESVRSLMVLEGLEDEGGAVVLPSDWL